MMRTSDLLVLDEPPSRSDLLVQHESEKLAGEVIADGRTDFLCCRELDRFHRLADQRGFVLERK